MQDRIWMEYSRGSSSVPQNDPNPRRDEPEIHQRHGAGMEREPSLADRDGRAAPRGGTPAGGEKAGLGLQAQQSHPGGRKAAARSGGPELLVGAHAAPAESAGCAPCEAAALARGLHVRLQGVAQLEEGDQDVNTVGVRNRYTVEGAGPPVSQASPVSTLLPAGETGGRGGCCPGFWRRVHVTGSEIALVASSSSPP